MTHADAVEITKWLEAIFLAIGIFGSTIGFLIAGILRQLRGLDK